MEFHTRTRRELQALCKKNKIPANITNAAMVEALKALEIVEGIEEFSQLSQSETEQSSIDSLEGSEMPSPYVPQTGGRTTRRRNVMKEEPEAVTSVTVTRRTTRRTAAKASSESRVDIMETPAFMSQTSRKKSKMASARWKMDTQLKECVEEEEKKDVSMTPAPLGNTGRKKRVEVGTVQKVYSTRRSVRLAESNDENSENQENEESELVNNELLTKNGENQDVNLSEDSELSGITGFDAITNMGNYENKEESEVVSAEMLDVTHDGESCIRFAVEAQPDEEISNNVEVPGIEDSVDPVEAQLDEEISVNVEVPSVEDMVDPVDAQLDEKISDNIEVPGVEDSIDPVSVSDEAKQSEGHVDICISEIETTVQNLEELDVEIDVGDSVEQVLLESKDKITVDDDAELCDEVREEVKDDKIAVDDDAELCVEVGEEVEDGKVIISPENVEDFNVALEKLTELRLQQEENAQVASPQIKVADDIEEADHLAIGEQLKKSKPDEVETPGSQKAADEEQASEAAVNDAVASEKNSQSKQLSGAKEETGVVQQNKNCAMILSDNKENIGTGTKQVIKKDRIKVAKESLNDISLRKLTKMFKEKLEISKNSSNEALPRAALQAKN